MELSDIWGRATVVGGPKSGLNLLFFISLDCPICKSLIPVVQSVALSEGADLIFVSDCELAAPPIAQKASVANHTYLHSETVGRGFAVGKLPYAVLLDTAGCLSFGIVNNREHLESLFVASDTGVGTVQEYVEQQTE